jgi:two-component system, OmpR family, response regulator
VSDRILIVEDDREIADFLAQGLRGEGYEVDVSPIGLDLPGRVEGGGYRVVILDRMLPDVEGAEICRRLRESGDRTMVLMLTAMDATGDKVEGLQAGADDYMTKPFAFEELIARVGALLRRAPAGEATAGLEIGDLRLDLARKLAWRGGHELALTATEFALLRYLTENAGRVVSRHDILKAVWGYDFDPHTNIVEVYIAYLRKKVDHGAEQRIIRNHRGFGYSLATD